MKREEKRKQENIQKLGEELAEKKKLPKEVKDKINAKAFENIAMTLIILIFLFVLNLGMENIPTDMYLTDLKVFSILLLTISIILFEYGYNKDNENVWLHGVEVVLLGIFTLYLVYMYSMYYSNFGDLIIIAALVYIIYYAIKMAIIRKRIKREYLNSLTDIRKIVKKG